MLLTSRIEWKTLCLSTVPLVMLASVALAGGFHLSVETPTDVNDQELKNVVLLVRTFGCHQPSDASVFATAEGLVKGKRQTIKMHPKPTSKGVYALSQQWPSDGVWVLAVRGSYLGHHSSVLVELGPNGIVPVKHPGRDVQSKTLPRGLSTQEVEEALRNLAARLAAETQQAVK